MDKVEIKRKKKEKEEAVFQTDEAMVNGRNARTRQQSWSTVLLGGAVH
jgi:hypothetical protein